MINSKASLNRWLSTRQHVCGQSTAIAYDRLPITKLLFFALRSGKLKIEVISDRTGWSKTWIVYRLMKSAPIRTFDCGSKMVHA